MKASDYIIDFIVKQKVRTIFGYIGGMITHLVDSATSNNCIDYIQVYHEQTAAIAAEGYAKESGNIGVAISTSGPGATNMVTGIADAYFDSIPVVYITGQVNTYEYKYTTPIRQLGFQETNIIDIVKPITKYAVLIDHKNKIRYELEKAFHYAREGRPGPVLLDIPMDIQRAEIDPETLESFDIRENNNYDYDIKEVIDLIENAKYPMILAGAGCQNEKTKKELDLFAIKTKIPVVSSLMGKGAIDEQSGNYLGMIGSYGNRCANMAISKVDLLLALGTRLDIRQTGIIGKFMPDGKILHVNIDKNELIHNRLNNRLKVHSDVFSFLHQLNGIDLKMQKVDKWLNFVKTLKTNYNQNNEIERFVENKSPYRLIQKLSEISKEGDIFCADIGQNQMWAAQTLSLKKRQKFITSGGLAPMGFSIPASIGIAFANPDANIYSINGDGGFHIALQSLMLISQYNLPIKVIIMNNNSLGMITQFQRLYFQGRMSGTTKEGGYCIPDIKYLSQSYNLKYYKLSITDLENDNLLSEIIQNRNCIIEYVVDGLTTVSPKLEYNNPIELMTPFLPDNELNMNIY
ncbi:MAG: thiamine pyrophosphate-binding protein [Tannerella sp.]|jgi:acetolactate synthase-1/2/3 large subunit|nr:thiamine pyrophosphate-binding protein [Tannerella sp.]